VLRLSWYTADSIRDLIRTKINDSQVPNIRIWKCIGSDIEFSVDLAV